MGLGEEVIGLPFIEKLCAVVEQGELDFWEDRRKPPNLTVDEFRKVLDRVDVVEDSLGSLVKVTKDHTANAEKINVLSSSAKSSLVAYLS